MVQYGENNIILSHKKMIIKYVREKLTIITAGKESTMKKRQLRCMIAGMLTSILICNQFPITSYAEGYAEVKAETVKSEAETSPVPSNPVETTEQPTSVPTAEPTPTEEPTPTPAPAIIKVELKELPSKLTYMLGEKFDLEGLLLEATLDNGTIEVVSPDFIPSIEQQLGHQEVVAAYGEYQFSIPITVTPAKVADIFKASNSTKSITLEWEKAEGAEIYEIYQYDNVSKEYQLIGKTEKLTYKINNLTAGTRYSFKIKSVATVEETEEIQLESPFSDEFFVSTRPLGVEDAQAVSQTDTTVTIKWAEVAGADGYNVYWYNSTEKKYELIGSTKKLTYTEKKLNSGTIYKYRVKAYTEEKDNTGAYSALITTGTLPAKATIKSIKAGTKKARITWNKVNGASGYYIYKSTKANSNYVKAMTITSGNITSHELEKLGNNGTYYFKISAYKNIASESKEGIQSAYVKKKIVPAERTSSRAKNYRNWALFKKSAAYKKYTTFRKNLVAGRTYVIPGIVTTNVRGFNSTSMCPQAITIAKKYMLMSAYDRAGEENSVIYVMDKKTRKYITTIVLPNKPHAGGLAFDGKNVWVSNGKKVGAISYSVIDAAAKARVSYKEVSYTAICPILTQASFMTYYDGKLWVGEYNEASSQNVYAYKTVVSAGAISLKSVNRMPVPSKTQGMEFLKDGTMILSRSAQVYTWAKTYLSRLEVYKPSKPTKTGYIRRNRVVSRKAMPPMAEGVVTEGNYTYLVFESAVFGGSQYPVDRICGFKTKSILKD